MPLDGTPWEVWGILLGVNMDLMDIGSIDDGDFFVKFRLRDRRNGFKWVLVAVYGVAQPEFKESFLAEMVRSCRSEKLPLCIGGISTLCGTAVKRIMIILMKDGLSSSMR
jgi:hypothetical protein